MSPKTVSIAGCVLFAVLVGVLLVPFGCAPSLVGENAAVYSMGRLHARVDREMNAVYEASVAALEKLEVTVTEKRKDVFAARVLGKTSDNQNITIKIEPESDTSTVLSIYTGVVGNEMRARAIYDEIRKGLGTGGK